MPTLPVSRSANDKLGRRKKGTVQATSTNVATVDPSVTRPGALNPPKAAFKSVAGIGAEELAPGVQDLALQLREAEKKEESQKDALAMAEATNQFNEEGSTLFDQFTKERDPSKDEDKADYGNGLEKTKQFILSQFTGSDEALARLEVNLENQHGTFVSKGAGESRRVITGKVDKAYEGKIADFISDSGKNTNIESIRDNILQIKLAAIDYKGAWGPLEEKVRVQDASDRAVKAALDTKILDGDLDGASLLLENMSTEVSGKFREAQEVKIKKARSDTKSIEFAAQKAGAVKTAELTATFEIVNKQIGDLGLSPVNPGGVVPPTIAAPFNDGAEPSAAMTKANTLVAAAFKLGVAGMTGEASQLMQQAKFIMSNSPEIQNAKELDKIVSPEVLAMWQGEDGKEFKVGTTYRDLVGLIPPSQEEISKRKARGAAAGREEVKAETQIMQIGEATTMIDGLLEEINIDPNIVGITGSLRSTGQTALGVISDLGFDGTLEFAKDIAFAGSDMSIEQQNALLNDPTISALDIMGNSLGFMLARLRQPENRLSVDAIERGIRDTSLIGFSSSAQIKNRLTFVKKLLDARRNNLNKRFGLGDSAKDTNEGTVKKSASAPAPPEGSVLIGTSSSGRRVWETPSGTRLEEPAE